MYKLFVLLAAVLAVIAAVAAVPQPNPQLFYSGYGYGGYPYSSVYSPYYYGGYGGYYVR